MRAEGLLVPPGWDAAAEPALGLVRLSAPTCPPSGFRPGIVLTRLPLVADEDPRAAWEASGAVVEDEDAYDTDLGPARYYRVGWRADRRELVGEIWCWEVGDEVFTLTGCVARADFALYTDLLELVAATFRPAA